LIGKLTQPGPVRRVRARPRVGGAAHAGSGVWHALKGDGSPMLSGSQRRAAGARRPCAKLLRAGRQYLDLALPHSRVENEQLALARIGALAGQRVELPQVLVHLRIVEERLEAPRVRLWHLPIRS